MERASSTVPQWTLADRLRKALEHASVSGPEMAEYLEVHRNTVSNWIYGHARPPASAVKLWAMRCGVPYEWLIGDELATQRHKRSHYQHQLDDSADTPPTTAEIKSFLKATPLTHGADRRANPSAVAS